METKKIMQGSARSQNEKVGQSQELEWWMEDYGFFGEYYMEGDDSSCGYRESATQNLSDRTKTEVNGIIKLLDLKQGEEILDLPCGYGRHSIGLHSLGHKVVGVDINTTHLKSARKSAKIKGVDVTFVKENMIDINYKNRFDALINMFYSFGFFKTDDENMQVLRKFYESLNEGGRFLMHTDVNIPRLISGKYKTEESRKLRSDHTLRIVDNYNPFTKRIDGLWIITDKEGREVEKKYSVRVYTKKEFVEMCYEVGFKKCIAFSEWDGESYHEDSEDMMIVAYK